MNEWLKWVSEYGALGVLTLIFFLFAIGKILSKKTVDRIERAYEKNLEGSRKAFENTIDNLCKNHAKETKIITASFNKSLAQLKEVIRIFKKQNGIKD